MTEIVRGVDAKILQYEEYAQYIHTDKINLTQLIQDYLIKKSGDGNSNCILINLEKDFVRYNNSLEEFKKISFNNFVHLKGTYWKERIHLENDLFSILEFLQKFNDKIVLNNIKIDEFSEINDNNIHIQDGPLACYCSHLRAMIYGYLNFSNYTIIVEDDISITNTENIEKYLKQIPDDWDIVCLNSSPKNTIYTEPFYKFIEHYHSSHFVIYNNKCFPKIFKNVYPITDQIDVLVSNLIYELNIYNIEDTVYQKNIKTNTQNNLHVIFNSPNYFTVRESLKKIKNFLIFFINHILPGNKKRNEFIVSNLIYDVLYDFILRDDRLLTSDKQETFDLNILQFACDEYDVLVDSIFHFVQCSKKGINAKEEAFSLLKVILHTMQGFSLHNKLDDEFQEKMKAYSFGSTAHIYLLKNSNVMIKKYNEKFRWVTSGHEDSLIVFIKELNLIQKVQHLNCFPKLIGFDLDRKILKLSYEGESLYNNFQLPKDWKSQINEIFLELDRNNIFYPEFRLQNILILKGKIKFCDFGLAQNDTRSNAKNCEKFIVALEKMQEKFIGLDRDKIHQLCSTYFNNEN